MACYWEYAYLRAHLSVFVRVCVRVRVNMHECAVFAPGSGYQRQTMQTLNEMIHHPPIKDTTTLFTESRSMQHFRTKKLSRRQSPTTQWFQVLPGWYLPIAPPYLKELQLQT